MSSKFRFIEFNIGILAISSSGVLGRYLTISSTIAIFWRCVIAAFVLYFIVRISKITASFGKIENKIALIGSSILLAIHWLTYFYALDYSNVSIVLMTLYTFPSMTAIIEPIWRKKSIPTLDVFLAITALFAIYIIAPPFKIGFELKIAVFLGLVSALAYSIRNIWLGDIGKNTNDVVVMMYQLVIVGIILSPATLLIPTTIASSQWGALIMLGIITTAIGHTLFLRGISYYHATTASILASSVPVFGIGLAFIFLDEIPSKRTVLGGVIIIMIVLIKAIKK